MSWDRVERDLARQRAARPCRFREVVELGYVRVTGVMQCKQYAVVDDGYVDFYVHNMPVGTFTCCWCGRDREMGPDERDRCYYRTRALFNVQTSIRWKFGRGKSGWTYIRGVVCASCAVEGERMVTAIQCPGSAAESPLYEMTSDAELKQLESQLNDGGKEDMRKTYVNRCVGRIFRRVLARGERDRCVVALLQGAEAGSLCVDVRQVIVDRFDEGWEHEIHRAQAYVPWEPV